MIFLLIILAALVLVAAIFHERDPKKKMGLQEWGHNHNYINGKNQNRD